MNAKPRKTNLGDGPISDWHRTLGADMPATNLDFLMVEYDRARPKAVIEYKRDYVPVGDRNHPTYQAVRELCAARTRELPFYLVRYAENLTRFEVLPFNVSAYSMISDFRKVFNEAEYVRFLERLRNTKREV